MHVTTCKHVQAAKPFLWFLPTLIRLNNIFRPGKGAAVLIPSSLLRYLTFKLTMDLQQIPALQVQSATLPLHRVPLCCPSLHYLHEQRP